MVIENYHETKQMTRNPKTSRNKSSLSKTRNNAETIRSAITKANLRAVKAKQKKPASNCGNRRRAHAKSIGYRPIRDEQEQEEPEVPGEGELQAKQTTVDTDEDSVIMRGDNLPIVDLSKYHTDGKEAHYIQINHFVGALTENGKMTEENIKKAEFNFMLDLKTLISKTAIDPKMTRVRSIMRREEKDTAPESYRPVFDNPAGGA